MKRKRTAKTPENHFTLKNLFFLVMITPTYAACMLLGLFGLEKAAAELMDTILPE